MPSRFRLRRHVETKILPGVAAFALAATVLSGAAHARDQIRIVGSSTVFPFSQAVAEQFANMTGRPAPVVESTGTGGGMKIFCQGVGERHPDIAGASRPITDSEFRACRANGVDNITEVLIGYDGLSLTRAKAGPDLNFNKAQLFQALAAEVEVGGQIVANPYQKWSEIDASLPDVEILVFGPPPTSGTRDAWVELVMDEGCSAFAAIAALDDDRRNEVCQRMRQDGPFIEAGENDNLIVQRLAADRHAFGIFGFSFLYENLDTLSGVAIDGVAPSIATIADGSYQVSRPLFFYIKNAHRGVIPGLQEFVSEYVSAEAIGEGGYLGERGLIPLSPKKRAATRDAAESGSDKISFAIGRAFDRGQASPRARTPVIGYALLLIAAMTLAAYVFGRGVGKRIAGVHGPAMHSLPGYHGAFVAAWVAIPALLLVLIWLLLQGPAIDRLLIASLPDSMTDGTSAAAIQLIVSEIKNVATGQVFTEPSPDTLAAAERYRRWGAIAGWAMLAVVSGVMLAALGVARARLAPRFRARNSFERILSALMILCSVVAIITTLGIVVSLVVEAWRFFAMVPITEFLFGLRWEPQIPLRADQVAGLGAFGAIPVFTGTLLIAAIAMLVATPIGLFTAIYLVEYANDRVRAIVKPLTEILAGVPTVVYGFFAVLTVAPAMRQLGGALGVGVSPNSALAAGVVMGIMIIPFISSLSDDALNAVPSAMRDGSLALGATPSETMMKVLLPAALPGITGGVLLGVSRAIGETMIVVMAAGLIASLTANPLNSVTTVTVQIVTLLIGDTEFDSPKTLAAFALGLVLFLVTLVLNVAALAIVRRYREKYD